LIPDAVTLLRRLEKFDIGFFEGKIPGFRGAVGQVFLVCRETGRESVIVLRWGRGTKAYGACERLRAGYKVTISKPLIEIRPDEYLDTLAHELAHAVDWIQGTEITRENEHGPAWQAIMRGMGFDPQPRGSAVWPTEIGREWRVCACRKQVTHRTPQGWQRLADRWCPYCLTKTRDWRKLSGEPMPWDR
jgi:predicted SprT family Zn-dependent metalloprotease